MTFILVTGFKTMSKRTKRDIKVFFMYKEIHTRMFLSIKEPTKLYT